MLDQITRPVEQALQTQPVAAKKNIILLSDGTGNSAASVWRTNVWRTFQALDLTGSDQIAIYDDGVGTSSFKPLALIGGAFGYGLKRNVLDLYAFLCRNYEPGVDIFAFGFSRGAYTVRIVTGLIHRQGLIPYQSEPQLRRDVKSAYRAYRWRFHTILHIEYPFRVVRDFLIRLRDRRDERRKGWTPYNELECLNPDIRFLGVWDTVAAYGSPLEELTTAISQWIWPMELPDRDLSKRVNRACHALAMEDERTTFHPLIWSEKATDSANPRGQERCRIEDERISQVWFSGVHSNVGGGYPDDSLAYIPLCWMLEEAKKCGLRLKENPSAETANKPLDPVYEPDAVKQAKSARDKDGRLYDSRRGLGGYYRYGPRKIHDLCNIAKSWISPYQVEVKTPKIHSSVFKRIANGAHVYAPFGLPKHYAVVDDQGNILGPAANPYETPQQAEQRSEAQEHVWDLVWHKRVNYFLTLFATAVFVVFPICVRYGVAHVDVGMGAGSWAAFLSPAIELVGSFLPGFLKTWVHTYAAYPGWFVGLGLPVVLLTLRGTSLGTQITDMMRSFWTLAPHQWSHQALPRTWVYRLRSQSWYRQLIGATKRHVIPFMLLIVLVCVGLVGLSRVFFTAGNSLGLMCDGTRYADLQHVPHTADPTFDAKPLCWPSGIRLERDTTYQVAITLTTPRRDDTIPTTPEGFFGAGHMSLPMYAALPLKRDLDANWFQPIARIGRRGLDEHRLEFKANDRDPMRFTAKLKPRSSGELFLFVNDAVIGLPWLAGWFHSSNEGKARVKVELAPK